jgi:mRNA interferase HicA
MKRDKLMERLNENGAVFIRHGKKHDIYENPRTHEFISIPRHPDINEYTAKGIIKKISK